MTLDDKSVFLDTNILIYANITAFPLHQVALNTINALVDADIEIWLSRQILREFIAATTRPQSYTNPLPIDFVIQRVELFEKSFQIADDTSPITANLCEILREIPAGGKQIHDANIVATMLTVGVRNLLTHNVKDFNRFSSLITVVPLINNS